jgi:hypothetical protein
MVENVSYIVESLSTIAVEVVKEVPDRVEKVPLLAYNEEVTTC